MQIEYRLFSCSGYNKVNFPRNPHGVVVPVKFTGIDHSDINREPTQNEFGIQNVFHDVCHFLLAESDAGVSKTDVLAVVFAWTVYISPALDIIPFTFHEQKGIG